MDRYRMLPSYRYYDAEGTSPLTLDKSVGKPLRDYKIYGNSIQDGTPSPDNPVEVQSCGDKSKNLITAEDGYIVKHTEDRYVYYDAKTQVFTINGNGILHYISLPEIIPSGTVVSLFAEIINDDYEIAKGDVNVGGYGVSSSWQNNLSFTSSSPKKQSKVFTVTEDVDRFCIFVYTTYQCKNVKMRITYAVYDKEFTEYEPYGYKIPIGVGGKNLFDIEAAKDKNNWSSGVYTYARFSPFVFKKGVHYTISMSDNLCSYNKFPLSHENTQVAMVVSSSNSWSGIYIGNSTLYQAQPTKINVYNGTEDMYLVLFRSGDATLEAVFETIFPDFQIEEGTTATEYEPYEEPIKTNIYLDEPLYKIGDCDDYIDFKSGKVVRNVNKVSLNGTENWTMDTTKDLTQVFRLADIYLNPSPKNYCCNRFIASNPGDTEKVAITIYIFIAINKTRADNVAKFKEWLSLNPTDVFYSLATPIEQPIDLPPILTHKDTNVISVGTEIPPSNMQIQYYK